MKIGLMDNILQYPHILFRPEFLELTTPKEQRNESVFEK